MNNNSCYKNDECDKNMKKIMILMIIVGCLLSTTILNISGQELIKKNVDVDITETQESVEDFDHIEHQMLDDLSEDSEFLESIPYQFPDNSISLPEYVPGELIVKFQEDVEISIQPVKDILLTGIQSIDEINNEYGGLNSAEKVFENSMILSLSNVYKFTFSSDTDVPGLVKDYSNESSVVYAEPNYIYYIDGFYQNSAINNPSTSFSGTMLNDPYFNLQWALHNIGQNGGTPDADIDAPEAWDITTGSSDVVIAILDTGVDYTHPDLVGNIWINVGEIPGNGIDDDGNGFIDDVFGWDFGDNDNDPLDFYGHGTHCAGIAGAVGNNGIGIAGVCCNSKIMSVKIGNTEGLTAEAAANGIIYAADNGANVISMSWGGGPSNLIKNALDYAYDNWIVLIAAAGNYDSSAKCYPAAYNNVIAVAATDNNDIKADFSNYGNWVDFAAPGVGIFSTMPTYNVIYNNLPYNKKMNYDNLSGTSMSAPFVAGVAGLVLSKNISLNPSQVKNILKYSYDPIFNDYVLGGGRINAYDALLTGPGPATVKINFPSHCAEVKDTIDIIGTVNGEGFQYFVLEYSKGYKPESDSWTELINSTVPVENSILVSLDTLLFDEGIYNIRLTLKCTNGKYKDTVFIFINNEPNTFYVDDDGGPGIDFTSIQLAVFSAGTGDTVFVYNGTYFGSIKILKTIKLVGENSTSTIIDGMFKVENVVWVYANRVNISSFTIRNASYFYGQDAGVYIHSYGNTIYDNIFYKNMMNIKIDGFHSNTIHNNTMNNKINLVGNPYATRFTVYIRYSENNRVHDNIIIGEHEDADTGIVLLDSHNNDISRNKVMGYPRGIKFDDSNNNIIKNNTIWGVDWLNGIRIENGINNVIDGNTVMNCKKGIHIWGGSYNIISNNLINSLVDYQYHWMLLGLDKSNHGITYGIKNTYSDNCSIYGNHITNCAWGVEFFYQGFSPPQSNNIVFHNNFIENDNNGWVGAYYHYKNQKWYNATLKEGNYWDDYRGVDIDGDGIGDTWYIRYGITDPYPLMNPLGNHNPPETPSKPSGPASGEAGEEYTYTTSTTDPDGHLVRYCWRWSSLSDLLIAGYTEWTPFYPSGETASISHTFRYTGIYSVEVKAEDIYGFESDWSDPFIVVMPYDVSQNPQTQPSSQTNEQLESTTQESTTSSTTMESTTSSTTTTK